MNAVIEIPMPEKEAVKAIKAVEDDLMKTQRAEVVLKSEKKGLKINVTAKDLSSLKAALNSTIKLLQLHEEVIKCLK